jgi:DNA-binding response OmpR family regulator
MAMKDFKVLLVDDEQEFVETLAERLQMRELDTKLVLDGEQPLEAVQDDEPDVMLLDLKMAGMDGMEVLRQVKKA